MRESGETNYNTPGEQQVKAGSKAEGATTRTLRETMYTRRAGKTNERRGSWIRGGGRAGAWAVYWDQTK